MHRSRAKFFNDFYARESYFVFKSLLFGSTLICWALSFGPGGQSDRRRNKWHDFLNYR